MTDQTIVKDVENVVVLFSGDSGDGMQLSGTIFSNLSAVSGNQISTFPDFPAEIRAPQGSLSGVSGFKLHLGSRIYNSGEQADVLVAMNPAALKVNVDKLKSGSIIIYDIDSFSEKDLEKAKFKTQEPFAELGVKGLQLVPVAITTLTKDSLADFEIDAKSKAKCKNMFALGLICWLFNRPLDFVNHMLEQKFKKKPQIAQANLKVLSDGYNYGQNTDTSVSTYRVETVSCEKGYYTDVSGNRATAYGLVAASEKSGRPLFLGSYPITPATDILQELVKLKELGVKAVQMEDEIAGISTAIGAAFAGNLAATSTSGPGLALKSEAIGLAVMAELPLVVIDVQRGGPSTGLPTKTEQTDLNQALYGRNGESPVAVVAATTPTNCFDSAYWASKIAMEYVTPVILLTDGYIANGSSAWKIPDLAEYPDIVPHDVSLFDGENWNGYTRDEGNLARYWASAGTPGFTHRLGGLEKDYVTGAISNGAANHQKMIDARQGKIDKIADSIPLQELFGDEEAELLIIGWGGTYGHLQEAVDKMNRQGKKTALMHFQFINPVPRNTGEILKKFKKIIVAEQNNGQFAAFLRRKFDFDGVDFSQYNKIEGQPFSVIDLMNSFTKKWEEK
jgi:2-oxoglutarate/2-oxoacid ferredoxin oxidoreductase subunit alpha